MFLHSMKNSLVTGVTSQAMMDRGMTDNDVSMNVIGLVPMDFSIGLLAYRKPLQEAQDLWDKAQKETISPNDLPKKANPINVLTDIVDKPIAGPTKETLQHIASGNMNAAYVDILQRTASGEHGDVVDVSKLDQTTQDKINNLQQNIKNMKTSASTNE